MKRILLASAMLGLAACSSLSNVFGEGDAAYKEEMLSANRYRISYTAQETATKAEIADRTLARAAQLTLDKGNDWFEVASTINTEDGQTLVVVMGSGETLAGGKTKIYDAKETLASLRSKGRIS